MTTITVAQLANLNLTAGQQAKLAQVKAFGDAVILYQQQRNRGATLPDISVGGLTLAQVKAIDGFVRDVNTLLNVIKTGTQYFRDKTLADAQAAADAVTPTAF